MIDSLSEDLISLNEAARSIPPRRSGKKPHISCIYRWTQKGCKGVLLESLQVGGTRMTTREALARFFAKLSEQTGLPGTGPTVRTTAQRERDHQRAERELSQAGY